jgi:integrase/recombinase XerD
MNSSNSSVTPLRLCTFEDMRMRQLAPRTQEAYIRAVYKLAAFTKKSPDVASHSLATRHGTRP